jgi:hypothetical protein
MIVVRTRDSRLFEEAYFVVRPDADKGVADGADMLWEANRILENSLAGARREGLPSPRDSRFRGSSLRGLIWFGAGLLTGGGASCLLWFLL